MKIINFTATEILPALLSKKKTQTIRPAWKIPPKLAKAIFKAAKGNKKVDILGTELEKVYKKAMYDDMIYDLSESEIMKRYKSIVEKPSRFVVGEKYKLMWNQRSKYSMFCRQCGKGWSAEMEAENLPIWCGHHKDIFPKVLGVIEATEVFQIEMDGDVYLETNHHLIDGMTGKECEAFAIRDGFKSLNEMYHYFDKNYDLSSPKKFWTKRWKWLTPGGLK